jgi:hypothetical protein
MLCINTRSCIDGTRGSEREFIPDLIHASVRGLFTVGKGRQNSSGLMQTIKSLAGEILVVGKGRL